VGDPDKPPYWRDVGTLDAYWEANMDLVQVNPQLNLYDENWPLWTWQPQSPPAKFVFDDDTRRGIAVNSLASGGCIISGATVRRSMLFSGVFVDSYTVVEDSIVLPSVHIGQNCLLKKCIIDRNCRIPDGTQIGVDPEKDRLRFRVTASGTVSRAADQDFSAMRKRNVETQRRDINFLCRPACLRTRRANVIQQAVCCRWLTAPMLCYRARARRTACANAKSCG
jgi:glucose-1-phosphate adenylyltransferase